MLRLLMLILVALAVGFALAVVYLPWYVTLGLVVLFVLSIKPLFKWFFLRRLPMMLLGVKSIVLRSAAAEVHAVEATARPVRRASAEGDEADEGAEIEQVETTTAEGESTTAEIITPRDGVEDEEEEQEVEEEEEDAVREWYRIDVTITPRARAGGMQHWEPSEMLLVPYGMRPTLENMETELGAQVSEVRVFDPETRQWTSDDPGKYVGPMRLQLTFGVRPDSPRRMKFMYYFEAFGDVMLPAGVGR